MKRHTPIPPNTAPAYGILTFRIDNPGDRPPEDDMANARDLSQALKDVLADHGAIFVPHSEFEAAHKYSIEHPGSADSYEDNDLIDGLVDD